MTTYATSEELDALESSLNSLNKQLQVLRRQIMDIKLTRGPQGEEGDRGEKGDRGIQGIPGVTGSAGVDGVNGIDGVDGGQGLQGEQGEIGPSGEPGASGTPYWDRIEGEDSTPTVLYLTSSEPEVLSTASPGNDETWGPADISLRSWNQVPVAVQTIIAAGNVRLYGLKLESPWCDTTFTFVLSKASGAIGSAQVFVATGATAYTDLNIVLSSAVTLEVGDYLRLTNSSDAIDSVTGTWGDVAGAPAATQLQFNVGGSESKLLSEHSGDQVDMQNAKIINVANPTGAQDADTKAARDAAIAAIPAAPVTSLIAGSNITLDPASGLGDVTISAAAGAATWDGYISDDVVVDSATNGLVLKDTQATPHYWRITIDNTGVLVSTDLGTTLP